MGQKTHPIGYRTGIYLEWSSRWYAPKKEFARLLKEDRRIRDFIKKEFAGAGIPKIEIERKADASGYPETLALLVEGVADKRKTDGSKIFFLRRVPADPISGEDWALRSYASTASEPQPGKDVFDVYSRSQEKGLNGVAYREW